MQEQIRKMHEQGVSVRKIAVALGVARQTVRKLIQSGATEEVNETLFTEVWHTRLDWPKLGRLVAKGVTVKQLHAEHAPEVKYWNFWRQLRTAVPVMPDVTLRLTHKPGERVEVDYADGIDVVNPQTGEATKTQLFCGVLPFSSYVFAEFVFSQKLVSFIESHERMWRFFGGVTPYAVVDNLKAGVHKAHRYDPDVNPTYCAYANHTGFAVLPARPYKPRDKPSVEANIGAIQRSFFQEVRERTFYSLAELNSAFAAFLTRFNTTLMKEYAATRAERFVTERPLLKPIPALAFEMTEWRQAKVHPDCHIQVEKNFYSVPFRMVGQTVRVRLTARLVEAFNGETELLATHLRLSGTGRMSTQELHYPDKKLGIRRFEVQAAREEAQKIGPSTSALVESLVEGDYPLKHLRRIQGILRLHSSGHVTSAALEYACQQALRFQKPRLQYVKACAEHFNVVGTKLKLLRPEREADDIYLHETTAEVTK